MRRIDAGEHAVERTPARNGAEFCGVKRIERYIDAANARRNEIARIFFKLRAIGRQSQFVESARTQVPRQRIDQRHDAAPHQRLAAGEAKLAYATRDKSRTQPVEFLQRQNLGLRQK